MPTKPEHILTNDEVKSVLQEAWNLGNPTLDSKNISSFKIKDFEVLEDILREFFETLPQFSIEIPSAGALLKLLHNGDTKRNKAVALVSFYILLRKDLLSNEEKHKLSSEIYGKNLLSNYTNRVKILTKIKEYITSTLSIPPISQSSQLKPNRLAIKLLFLGLILVIITAKLLSKPKINKEDIKWEITNKENINNQNINISVDYDISQVNYSKAVLDFGDGQIIPLQRNKGVISHTYNIPKVETLSLTVDDRKYIKNLIIPSRNWMAFANNVCLQNSSFMKNGIFHILENEETRTILNEEEFYVTYKKTQDFDIDIDDMFFEAKVKNPQAEGGISCYDISLDLTGINKDSITSVSFNLLKPGCTSWAKLKVGEVKLHPGNYNMNPSGQPTEDWKIVKGRIHNKLFETYVDDKLLYRVPFKTPLGKLKQIQVLFKGNGTIDYFNISSNDKKKFYLDDLE